MERGRVRLRVREQREYSVGFGFSSFFAREYMAERVSCFGIAAWAVSFAAEKDDPNLLEENKAS
jgi:hypothetical protein